MFGRASGSFRGTVNSRGSVSSISDGGYETPAETLEEISLPGGGGGYSSPFANNNGENRSVRWSSSTDLKPVPGSPSRSNIEEGIEDNGDTNLQTPEESNNTDEDLTPEKVDKLPFRRFKRPTLGKSLPARIFRRYPRTYSCLLGIIVPVWALVLIALLFGLILGELEFDGEIEANDAAMRTLAYTRSFQESSEQLIGSLSSVCFLLFQNVSIDDIGTAFEEIEAEHESFENFVTESQYLTDGYENVNLTAFRLFIDACGDVGQTYQERLQVQYFGDNETEVIEGDTSLSFNWVRCANRTDVKGYNRIFNPNEVDLNASRPQAQRQFYRQAWREDQERLEDYYFDQIIAQNDSSRRAARLEAFHRSTLEATGSEKCGVNVASGGRC